MPEFAKQTAPQRRKTKTTARGFEPLRAEPNGFLVHHINNSDTLSPQQSRKPNKQIANRTWRGGAGHPQDNLQERTDNGPHRLVVRTSRRGRDNPGSTPGVDICSQTRNMRFNDAHVRKSVHTRSRTLVVAATRRRRNHETMWSLMQATVCTEHVATRNCEQRQCSRVICKCGRNIASTCGLVAMTSA